MLVHLAMLSGLILISGVRLDINELFREKLPWKKTLLFSAGTMILILGSGIFFSGVPENSQQVVKLLVPVFPIWFIVLLVNKRYFVLRFFLPLAMFLNDLVITLNGWRMPVETNGDVDLVIDCANSPFHAVATANTRLPWLDDRLESCLIRDGAVASVGDVVLFFAIVYTAVQLAINLQKKALTSPRYL